MKPKPPYRHHFSFKKACDPIQLTGNPEIDDLLKRAAENDKQGSHWVRPPHWGAGVRVEK